MRRFLILSLLLWGIVACNTEKTEAPGSATRADVNVDEMLFGRQAPCLEDAECASGLCRGSTCIGALVSDMRWVQDEVGRRLTSLCEQEPAMAATLVETLAGAQERFDEGDVRGRARLAFLLGFVPGEAATELLHGWLRTGAPLVQREAALALVARGQDVGMVLALSELRDDAPLRRAEAARALGGLDRPAVRDALIVALEDDTRHVRRNVVESLSHFRGSDVAHALFLAFDEGPESDRVFVVEALRGVTGEQIGLDRDAWEAAIGVKGQP